jgi:uncharacterized protein YcfL
MRTRLALAGVMVVVLGISCGCSTTGGLEATGTTAWNDEGARVLAKRVVYNSGSLKGDLEVVDLKSALAGDLMRAQATLRSRDRDTLSFEYRFEWFDLNGIEIGAGSSSWKPLILIGRETKSIQASAPDPRAREFKLKLREPEQ